MASLLPCYLHIPKTLCTEPSPCLYNCSKLDLVIRKGVWGRSCVAKGCSSTTTTTITTTTTWTLQAAAQPVRIEEDREEFGYLVEQFGWKVRRLADDQTEMREVAQIQAEAFYTPVGILDDLFFQFFKAEVLSGLLYKLKNSPPDRASAIFTFLEASLVDALTGSPRNMIRSISTLINRYACLVAESAAESAKSQEKLVGTVDVTALRDGDVVQHLGGAEEYLYISGIAVSESFRRQKIGSVMLKACDVLSIRWGFEYLALRAYEDDFVARKLYSNAGYHVVSRDPLWMTWPGQRRRVLMIKRSGSTNEQS